MTIDNRAPSAPPLLDQGTIDRLRAQIQDDVAGPPFTIRPPEDNRIDIAIIGDGYTQAELRTVYVQHVNELLNELFGSGGHNEPLATYEAYFNIHVLEIASNESGADDPINGVYVDTALGATYRWDGVTDRLLYVDPAVTAAVVDAEMASLGRTAEAEFVLVNDDKYGGGGGRFAVYAAANEFATDIAVHEVGHSYGLLADEYDYSNGQTYFGPEPIEPNVTAESTGAKWSEWLGYNDPVLGAIGAYEGGRYHTYGIWRPSVDGQMHNLGLPFHAVSRQAFILEYYDDVDPLDGWSYSTASGVITDPQVLWVDPIDPGLVSTSWSVDGTPVGTGHTLFLSDLGLAQGQYTIQAVTRDETSWVRRDHEKLTQAVSWSVEIGAPTVELYDTFNTLRGTYATIADAAAVASSGDRIVATPQYNGGPESIVTALDSLAIETNAGTNTTINLTGTGPGRQIITASSDGNVFVNANQFGGGFFASDGDNTYLASAGFNNFGGGLGDDKIIITSDFDDIDRIGHNGNPTSLGLEVEWQTGNAWLRDVETIEFNDMSFNVVEEPFSGTPPALSNGDDVFAGRPGRTADIDGLAGQDIIYTLDGDDTVAGGAGSDTLDGGLGQDMLSFANGTGGAGVTVTFNNGRAVDTHGDQDLITGFEGVLGSALGDVISGNLENNLFEGNGGADRLLGQAGLDTLNGGEGDDTVSGGGDADSLSGGLGEDLVLGGGGADVALLGGDQNDTVSAGGGDDRGVDGGNGDDVVLGASGADVLNGGNDQDTISGGTGNDTAFGDDGHDLVLGAQNEDSLDGGTGNDTVSGGVGNDVVLGGAGTDRVLGAQGDDTLGGGEDNDLLSGGQGVDEYLFNAGDGADTIAGFEQGLETLFLDVALWTTFGNLTAEQVVTNFASQVSNGVIDFAFENGETLRVVNAVGLDVSTISSDIVFSVFA